MRRRTLCLAALALAGAVALPAHADDQGNGKSRGHAYGHDKPRHVPDLPADEGCVGDPSQYTLLQFTSGGQPALALVTFPRTTPRGIVVFDHGYSHTMYSWTRHMARTSQQLGVITVTPDYRGQVDTFNGSSLPSSRGWRVAEGAVDTNTVVQLLDRTCFDRLASARAHNVIYSVSMGGNTAGLALAAQPKRQGGAPLYDQWVDVEGAANVTETYLGARVLAPANTFAAHAVADIEQEMGGPLEKQPATYAQRTVVNRTPEIAASGITGVVMVHGYADGLVTHDISRQLQVLLRAQGVPVDFRSFLTHTAGSEPGTTLDGYLPTGVESPFAGHASEVSETQDVGVEGFHALSQLYSGYRVVSRDAFNDGTTDLHAGVQDGRA